MRQPARAVSGPGGLPARPAAGCRRRRAGRGHGRRLRRHSVTYDEAGGFYDHVTPPVPPSPAGGSGSMSTVDVDAGGVVTGEIHQNAPTYPGRRVPMIAVSPWSTGASSAPRPSTTPPSCASSKPGRRRSASRSRRRTSAPGAAPSAAT
ncbi:alkaline phosphatase family protein [Streptomyces cirratus]|uniref:alkaline phosphatase family protein n=1 Tax=Streptomyces cirratus TaxID=68187 RepID=UPI001E55397C|nr:alkaline phosphatase family protein [Streptomyces cirratus]